MEYRTAVTLFRLVWVSKSKPEVEKYAKKFDGYSIDDFTANHKQRNSDEEPVLVNFSEISTYFTLVFYN